MLGLSSANAKFACIYCIYDKTCEKEAEKEWSMLSKDTRTIEDAIKNANGEDSKKVYVKAPLIKSLPIINYIIDTLHMFLRPTDLLYELFFNELQSIDIEYHKNNNQILQYKPNDIKTPDVEKFLFDLEFKFKIAKPYAIQNNQIKVRDLSYSIFMLSLAYLIKNYEFH